MRNRRKKRAVTLIEIMIVILLIGLIGGALAYNMTGSLDEGKAFKSRQNIEKIHDILMIELSEGTQDIDEVAKNWQSIIGRSPLISKNNLKDLLKDGWKKEYVLRVHEDDIVIESPGLSAYERKKGVRPAQS